MLLATNPFGLKTCPAACVGVRTVLLPTSTVCEMNALAPGIPNCHLQCKLVVIVNACLPHTSSETERCISYHASRLSVFLLRTNCIICFVFDKIKLKNMS